MKLRFLIAIIFVSFLAVAAAACGSSAETTSSTQAASSAEVPDACAAFTKANAEMVLGEPVNEAERSESENTSSCSYTTKGAAPRTASVEITKPCSMADYSNLATNPAAEPIEGIGMHASWDKSVLLVHSTSGDTCVSASGGGNPPGTDPAGDKPALEQAKKVATIVLSTLGSSSGSSTNGESGGGM